MTLCTPDGMGAGTIFGRPSASLPFVTSECREPRWYAIYTCANHEKRVAQQLEQRIIEHFLPSYEAVRRWKDRRMRLQLPLFPGYVFVRLLLRDKLQVLQIPSVVHLVGFGGCPASLPDDEINALREGLASPLRAQPYPYLTAGHRVRIIHGPLMGCEGILLRRKGHCRVVLSVDLIMRSIAVDLDLADLAPHLSLGRQDARASCAWQKTLVGKA